MAAVECIVRNRSLVVSARGIRFTFLAVFFFIFGAAQATEPKINFIELFGTNKVLIHFDTEANHTYVLQYSSSLTATNWSNMFTGFNYPFNNHYIIPDDRTTSYRFYRLRVTTP